MPDYQKFRQYTSAEEAAAVLARLQAHGIEGLLSDNMPAFDATFAYNSAQQLHTLSLTPEDFARSETLLAQWAEADAQHIDPDHYLLTFSVDELYDVLRHPAEWDVLDVKIATRLLRERGHVITARDLAQMQAQETQKMAAAEPVSQIWLLNGYLFSLMGGVLGILIGYMLWSAQKTLPDGRKVHLHPDSDRRHGKWMMVIGVVMFFVILALSGLIPYASDQGYFWW
jgi:hypothetical protein